MESSSQRHYDWKQDGLTYSFVTKEGIIYRAYFVDLSVYYPNLPNTFSFSLEPENPKKHRLDLRISATVAEILKQFFQKQENAMIMVCDSLDGKEEKRRKLFDHWFDVHTDDTLLKYDVSAPLESYHLFISLIFKKTNPNKELLLRSFFDLLKTDLYQIGF